MTKLSTGEIEMFHFFEMTPDLVIIASRDGYFKKVNQAVITKLGYTEEELKSKPIASFIHPEDKEQTGRLRKRLLEGKALVNFQNRYLAKSGEVVWLQWTSIYSSEKEVVFALAKDVTQNKKAEKEIEEKYEKFKSLATHFKSSIERERKFLAVELHEELAQMGAVVKMDINWVCDHVPDLPEAAKARMKHATGVADLLIKSIRRISFSISPNMIEDMGLKETMKWLANEFALLNGIPCRFEGRFNENKLSEETQLDFFRICQEALSNVMYHAQASQVIIRIEEKDKQIRLCIIDNGKGFDLHQLKKSSGLDNIRKRAISINGHLNIKSEPGEGTELCVSVDL